MALQYTEVSDLTVTSGSPTVTINSGENLSKYKSGDFIYVTGQNPLIISSIAAQIITLVSNATFSTPNTPALVVASNVPLRQALSTIEENNSAWSLHFQPFMDFVDTSSPNQINLVDVAGNPVLVYSAIGLNALAADIAQASSDFSQLETDVTNLSNTVGTIQGDLDQKVLDAQAEVTNAAAQVVLAQNEVTNAQAEVQKAKDWATKTTEVEIGLESAKTYAEQSGASATTANDAKNIAMANSNFKGEWSNLTGSLNIPASVKDSGTVYMLLNNLADVTLSQPSANPSDWFVLGVIGSNAPDSDRLGGELPNYYATQSQMDDVEIFSLAGLVL